MKTDFAQLVLAAALLAPVAGSAQDFQPSKSQVDAFAREARRTARDGFKDPAAAQFKGLFVSAHTFEDESGKRVDSLWLCGEVNGKNSYGAYTGFRRFVYAGSGVGMAVNSDPEHADLFDDFYWRRYCDKRVRDVR